MKALVILAHPQKPSLSAHFAALVTEHLGQNGHSVRLRDLYAEGYDPVLNAKERAAYYQDGFEDAAGLSDTEALVLVFPTWWFGLPAILKGWIDRSFLPGVAYDHADAGGPLRPRLKALRHVLVITTLGSPGWFDRLLMRRPLRRTLKSGLIKPCAPKARFRMLSLYKAENPSPDRIARFSARIRTELDALQ